MPKLRIIVGAIPPHVETRVSQHHMSDYDSMLDKNESVVV